MKEKILSVGDKVKLLTKTAEFEGVVLESYEPEIILLKLKSGYNIGLRESEILNVKVLEKAKEEEKSKLKFSKDEKLPNIGIIITGGTISSRLDSKTGAVKWTSAEDLLKISPEISKICNIVKVEKPFMKASENMSFKDWSHIAQVAERLLNDSNIKGIIITHGTDFLHYSSAALSFFLRNLNKPVALTYSQRSIDRGSTDAALNLLCAAKYAISDIAEVAIIGHKNLDDEICLAMPGTKVRKMHTSRRDTFKVINSQPFAEISEKEFHILREFNARNFGKVINDSSFNEKIALLKVYPGQDPEILEYYAEKGFKGIILEVSGLGHVPSDEAKFNWIPKIKKIIDKGIVVCASCQTLHGSLNPKVYSPGRDLEKTGVVFLKDMLPETAFVKLGYVLAHQEWKDIIKEKMLENFSNEFNSRLSFDFN